MSNENDKYTRLLAVQFYHFDTQKLFDPDYPGEVELTAVFLHDKVIMKNSIIKEECQDTINTGCM